MGSMNTNKPFFFRNAITIAGGSMFLSDPVYVISWYITLIMLLYFVAFAFESRLNMVYRFVVFLRGL